MQRLLLSWVAIAVSAVWLLASAPAAEKEPDPTGTWKWTVNALSNVFTMQLELKRDGDKLAGYIVVSRTRSSRTSPIEDGKLQGDEISFQVSRELMGEKQVTKYKGKIVDNIIRGTMEASWRGQTKTNAWQAKREQ